MNPNERRLRLREQIKEFYGDPDAAAKHSQEDAFLQPHPPGGVSPEMDLDSESFNALRYTTDLLRRESLKGLVEADTDLLRNMRRLDRALQELVYRNYSKFISATDTIREMKDNVLHMDSKLRALSANLASIDGVSQAVSERLREHRSRVERTITTNRMLQKVQFLVNLPRTMRLLLEKQAYSGCVKYWVAGDALLGRHSTIPSIAEIHQECAGLAMELYANLEAAMAAVPLDDPEAMDTIREYVEDLKLLRATTLFEGKHQAEDAERASFEGAILRVLMRGVVQNFANGVAAVRRGLKTALEAPAELRSCTSALHLQGRADVLVNANLRESLTQLKSTCAILFVNTERAYSLMGQASSAAVALRVTEEVQPVLIDILEPLAQGLGTLVWASCSAIVDEGRATTEEPQAVCGAMLAAVHALGSHLKHMVVTLKTLGANYLDTALGCHSSSYAGLVDQAVARVLQHCIGNLEAKAVEAPSRAAVDAMRGTGAAGCNDVPATRPLRFAFCISRFTYASLAASLAEVCTTHLLQGDLVAAEQRSKSAASLMAVAKDLQHRGIVLLGQLEVFSVWPTCFCSPGDGGGVHSALLALVKEWDTVSSILQALPPTLSTTSPLGVSNPATSYTSRLYGGGGSSAGLSSGSRGAVGGLNRGPGAHPTVAYMRREAAVLQSSVARIFSYEPATYHTVPRDGRPATTIACVVLYVLKALVDDVRLVPFFDTHSFQATQLHCSFLLRALLAPAKGTPPRQWLKQWDDATRHAIRQQLDELCISAYERYEAKVPLQDAIIDALLATALAPATPTDYASLQKDEPTTVVMPPVVMGALNASPTASPPSIALEGNRHQGSNDDELLL